MSSFINYQREVEKLIREQDALYRQYQKAIDNDRFYTMRRELENRIKKIRDKIKGLKMDMDGIRTEYRTFNIFEPGPIDGFDIEEQQIVERIEKTYVFLEHLARTEAKFFSDAGRGNLRKAQSELQRIRLWLYDVIGSPPPRLNRALHDDFLFNFDLRN